MTEGKTESRQCTRFSSLPRGMSPGFYRFMAAGCIRDETGGLLMTIESDEPLDPLEAYRTQSSHWGSMVSPVAQIVRVKRCEHCGTAPAEVGPLCLMCEEDRKEKYGI